MANLKSPMTRAGNTVVNHTGRLGRMAGGAHPDEEEQSASIHPLDVIVLTISAVAVDRAEARWETLSENPRYRP